MKRDVLCLAVCALFLASALPALGQPPTAPTKGTGVPPGFGRCTAGKAACPIECYGGIVGERVRTMISKIRQRDSERKSSLTADTPTYVNFVNQKTKAEKAYEGGFAEVVSVISDGLAETKEDGYIETLVTGLVQASYFGDSTSLEAAVTFDEAGDVASMDFGVERQANAGEAKANITITGHDGVYKIFNEKAKSLKPAP